MSGDTTTVDSEMSTSVNSDASLDIDIVRHHDGMQTFRETVCNPTFPVATSTANLLDTRYSDTETDSEDDLSQIGRSKIVKNNILIVKYGADPACCFSPREWQVAEWSLSRARGTRGCTPGWGSPG